MLRDDSFFQFREHRIVIPGIRGEHLLMHVTDTHLNAVDDLTTAEELRKVEAQEELWSRFKGKFADANGEAYGDPQRISTREAFDKTMDLAAELAPEALLLAGDNLDYMHPAGARYLAKRLAAYPGRYLCVPGNHEDPACPGCWDAGVRVLDFDGGFRVAAVDDRTLTVSDGDLAAFRALCAEGVPLLVLCHVPLITPYCRDACTEKLFGKLDYFYLDGEREGADDNAREFIRLCETEEAVKAVLCGHVHGWHEMELAPGRPQYVGSPGLIGAVHLVTVCGE